MKVTGNKIELHMSSGPTYPPIVLTVHEFIPANKEFLALSYAPPNVNNPTPALEQVYAPPFGLLEDNSRNKLRKSCREHIKAIIRQNRAACEARCGDVAPLSWEIHKIVHHYRLSQSTLRNVRQLSSPEI
jgi:hypothetical protein